VRYAFRLVAPVAPRRLVAAVATAALLALPGAAWPQTAPNPESQNSVCTPNTNVCFNQYASRMETRTLNGTTGPTYVIRANVNERNLTFGSLSWRRAILIFTERYDPDTRTYVTYLVAQAPFCWQGDCYVEWLTRNASEAAHAFWWGATLDNHNHVLIARAGFPSA
jgi:hypothetical protein